ncbi:MAG: dTDP-4-amino-4,6-dideoxy-D-galactose acyltransferase [Enterobacteriaceae bacterium]
MCVRGNMTPLEWENDFFSVASARLTLDPHGEVVTQALLNAYPLVQAKLATSETQARDQLASLGFVLAEGEIDLQLSLTPGNTMAEECGEQPLWQQAQQQHIGALRTVAEQVFTLSRFRPPWYQAQDNGRLYTEWVHKAVLGTYDHCCLLAIDEQGVMEGFVTLRHGEPGEARVGLLAVCPEHHGKGIGTKLIGIATHWCRQHQINQVRIATQISNIQALRLYIRCGALPVSSSYWFYRGYHDSI